jgi:hypothetical protein
MIALSKISSHNPLAGPAGSEAVFSAQAGSLALIPPNILKSDPAVVAVNGASDASFRGGSQAELTAAVNRARGRTTFTFQEQPLSVMFDRLQKHVSEANAGRPLRELRVTLHGNGEGRLFTAAFEAGPGRSTTADFFLRELSDRGIIGPGTRVYFHSCNLASDPQGRQRLQAGAEYSGAVVKAWDAIQWNVLPPVGQEHVFRPRLPNAVDSGMPARSLR